MSRQLRFEPELVALALERAAATIVPLDHDTAWLALERRLDATAAPVGAGVRHLPVRLGAASLRRRLVVRGVVAVAAALVALAAISMKAVPGSPLYSLRRGIEETALVLSPNDAGLHVRIANARLDDLVRALEQGPVESAPDLARALVTERAAAVAAGADVSELDRSVAAEVPAALAAAPVDVAADVAAILGSLIPPGTQQPAPGSGTGSVNGSTSGGGTAVGPPGGSSSHGSSDGSDSGATGGDSTGSGSDETSTSSGDGSDQGSGDSEDSSSGDSKDSGSGDSQGSGRDTSDSSPSSDPSPTCDPSSCDGGD